MGIFLLVNWVAFMAEYECVCAGNSDEALGGALDTRKLKRK